MIVYFISDFIHHLALGNEMPLSVNGELTLEKTPSYFVTRDAPERIYRMSPLVKLILVVRDPVTRAISDYAQQVAHRGDEMKPFEKMAFINDSYLVDTSWGAIKIGLYCKHLAKWYKYFSPRQILFVSGERLITNPAQEMRNVQKFLSLEVKITEKDFYFNKTKRFPCILRKIQTNKTRGGGGGRNRTTTHCLQSNKGRRHPIVDEKYIQRLKNFYKPFNFKFYTMTGIDFGW